MQRKEILLSFGLLACSGLITAGAIRVAGRPNAAPPSAPRVLPAVVQEALETQFVRGQRGGLKVVVFTDFQCPVCARQETVFDSLLQAGAPLELHFAQLPLTAIHARAFEYAKAAECGAQQRLLAPIHHALFELQRRPRTPRDTSTLSPLPITAVAARAGLSDTIRFMDCMADPRTMQSVSRGVAQAERLDIYGTPTLVIGDTLYTGLLTAERLAILVERSRRQDASR